MPLFHVPYRWLPHTIWTNISYIWSDLTQGVSNIFRWIPVIWFDRDWDWSYLADIMEYKLRRMSKNFTEHGHHVDSDRDARQTLICAELLKRLREENYYDNADKRFPERGKAWADLIRSQERQDQELLALMFKKYFRNWWG